MFLWLKWIVLMFLWLKWIVLMFFWLKCKCVETHRFIEYIIDRNMCCPSRISQTLFILLVKPIEEGGKLN